VSDADVPLSSVDEDCFQGVLPSPIGTVSAEGVPNVTSISIVHRIDGDHVALSRQFFNKTLANLRANPQAQVIVVSTRTGRQFKLDLTHERTEIDGPLFERMRTRLEAIASHDGMTSVFRLAAVDVCRVDACRLIPSDVDAADAGQSSVSLQMLADFTRRVDAAEDIDDLLTTSLDALAGLGYEHSVILLLDGAEERLYTVASRGYALTGAGAEVRVGDGIIGTAARRRQPVRLSNLVRDLDYARAVRRNLEGEDAGQDIPLPGLVNALSQIALPIVVRGELLGVLSLQSTVPAGFGDDDEALLAVAARQIGMALVLLRAAAPATVTLPAPVSAANGSTAVARHYRADDSIFIDNEYLIKGVAGQILWRLLGLYVAEQRVEFSNREMRLDASIELSDMRDNLDSRLVLLRRRLEDRCPFLRIHRTARGRFRLEVGRPIELQEQDGAH
jgi:hypothetical protein